MGYSIVEKARILEIYIKNDKNVINARREYVRLGLPNVPSRNTFKNVYNLFQESKNLNRRKRRTRNNENLDLNILLYFQEHPTHSIRDASRNMNLGKKKIAKVLHSAKMRPFKCKPASRLTEDQKRLRLTFCRDMIHRLQNDELFFDNILWTDEATFTTGGLFNRKNTHYWSVENPHSIKDIQFQGRTAIHVWCGVLKNTVLGPIFYRENLTGELYLNFLTNQIEDFLEEIPLAQYNSIIWHQDGAPPHNTRAVQLFLNNKYTEWIGKFGSIRWAPNSPDLSLLDTFLWGYLKNKVYFQRTENIQEIQDRISQAINELNNAKKYFIVNSVRNLRKRYQLCIWKEGGHFEQFL